MSHFKERKEKNCLNCNADVYGRYCHVCGQENIEPKESFGHLVTHFIYDITHFDSKFFNSVKYLLLKPAFLSKEYIRGKRVSYLNPIKMYVFISAFFFLFFFTLVKPKVSSTEKSKPKTAAEARVKIEKRINVLEEALKEPENPEFVKKALKDQLGYLQQDRDRLQKNSSNLLKLNYYSVNNIAVNPSRYRDVKDYDSVQNTLPAEKRHNWLEKIFKRKKIEIDTKYGNDKNQLLEKLLDKFLHTIPQLFFISLPLFALILKLLYIRRRNFYYADHVIYTVHLYCATFIFMFVTICIGKLMKLEHLHWLKYFLIIISIYITWFQYKSMRNFYSQGRGKTILKFFLVLLISSMLMSFLFMMLLIFSLFTI